MSPPVQVVRAVLGCALALAAVLPTGASASAAPHAAGPNADWSVRTADTAAGSGRTSYAYALEPGTTVQDALTVTDRGSAPLRVAFSAADGTADEEGRLALSTSAGSTGQGVGSWITGLPRSRDLPQGKPVTVPFTVAVPEDARPGDHVGGVVTAVSEHGVDRRLAIRVVVRVEGDLRPGLAVERAALTWRPDGPFAVTGRSVLRYTLHNTGNVLVTVDRAVAARGLLGWGTRTGGPTADPLPLLPGERRTVTTTTSGVPALGPFSATANVVPFFTDAAGSTSPIDPVSVAAGGWAVPWAPAMLLAVLALVVLGVVLVVLRRRRRPLARPER